MNNILEETSLIFPAFGIDYTVEELEVCYQLPIDYESYFEKASSITGIHFDKSHLADHFDELNSQYIAYIFSAAIADYLKNNKIITKYISSYSMGIYACLYYAETYDFATGLELIKTAYNLTVNAISGNKFGMAGVIGFEYNDLIKLINQNSKSIEIVNENNRLSFVIAGYYDEIESIVNKLITEGAMNTKFLPIKSCYHTKFNKAASEELKKHLNKININSINQYYVSSINQKIINNKKDIIEEIYNNLSTKLNWHKTMDTLIALKIKNFIECGLGKSLLKIGRFIDGDFKIHSIKNFNNILKKN